MINQYINQIRALEQQEKESENIKKVFQNNSEEALHNIIKKIDYTLLKMEISSYGLFKSKKIPNKNLHEGLNYHVKIHTYKKNRYRLSIQLLDDKHTYIEFQKLDSKETVNKKISVDSFLESNFEELMIELFKSLDKNYSENSIISTPKTSWLSAFFKKYIKKNENI